MGYSKLACRFYPANENNFSYGRSGYNIQKITIHHTAGVMSAESIGNLWQNPNRETSSNYGIGVNGEIMCYVDENNTSYCDSNWISNCTSITIENSNDSTGGEWHVGDETLNSLIKLCADENPDIIVGTSMGGMYAQQMRGFKRICINPE